MPTESSVITSFTLPEGIGKLFEKIARQIPIRVDKGLAFLAGTSLPFGNRWSADAKLNTLLTHVLLYQMSSCATELPAETVRVVEDVKRVLNGQHLASSDFSETHNQHFLMCEASLPDVIISVIARKAMQLKVTSNELLREMVIDFCRSACSSV